MRDGQNTVTLLLASLITSFNFIYIPSLFRIMGIPGSRGAKLNYDIGRMYEKNSISALQFPDFFNIFSEDVFAGW